MIISLPFTTKYPIDNFRRGALASESLTVKRLLHLPPDHKLLHTEGVTLDSPPASRKLKLGRGSIETYVLVPNQASGQSVRELLTRDEGFPGDLQTKSRTISLDRHLGVGLLNSD